MMRDPLGKRVPYISFSVEEMPTLLECIKNSEPIEKNALFGEASKILTRSRKTIQESVISLKNLGLVKEEDGKLSLTKSSSTMMSSKKDFWKILREDLLTSLIVSDILSAISLMSKEKRVTSNDEYYQTLSKILQTTFSFSIASPRVLDRFITLFRKTKILDYDPFSDEYFFVRKTSIDEKSLETLLILKYEEIRTEMMKRTATFWVPIDQLRSRICRDNGIEIDAVDRFLQRILEKNKFQFAEASASRKEVRKGGIEKNGKIYFYVKIAG